MVIGFDADDEGSFFVGGNLIDVDEGMGEEEVGKFCVVFVACVGEG